MYALLLQDWVTIRSGSGNAVTQGEAGWLDLSDFLDLVVFMETKNLVISAGNLMMAYQTAPTKDEAFFQAMNDVSNTTTGVPVALGVQTFVMLRDTALCPLARWVRWQLGPPPGNPSSASSFEATFRIWIAANAPGGYAHETSAHAGMDGMGGAAGPAYTEGGIGAPSAPHVGPQVPSNLPHVKPWHGYRGVGDIPGVKQWQGFKGVGDIPGVKRLQPKGRHMPHVVEPKPMSRVPYVPLEKKVSK